MKTTIKTQLTVLVFALILVLAACQPTSPTDPRTKVVMPGEGTYEEVSFDADRQVQTKSFATEEELLSFMKANREGSNINYYGGGMIMDEMVRTTAMDSVAESAPMAKAGSGAGGSLDYSETNVQVQGVDEADILKTDGNYIYTITGKNLFIIKAYPGKEAKVVSTIKFKDEQPQGIFIENDKLAVFGYYNNIEFFRDSGFTPRNGVSFLNVYDISDRDDPEVIEEYKFEGNYFDGRMTEGYAYILTRTNAFYRPDFPTPIVMEGNTRTALAVSDVRYFNIPYNNPQMVHIHAIDLSSGERTDSKSIVIEGAQEIYMSPENIYVTYTEILNEWELMQTIIQEILEDELLESDKILIEKIKNTDDEVLSRGEKQSKITQLYQQYVQMLPSDKQNDLEDEAERLIIAKLEDLEHTQFTVISKIKAKNGEIEPLENGKVPGRVLNQFAMDEYDGNLRVATTIDRQWSYYTKNRDESTNNVYVLDEDLDIIGELEGLAETEQIFSTRYMGDRLYMVTFRQVDPFFVIDLSNPENPKELGKLKIPGFSRYLHPYDENVIIGIGRDASETGRQRGLKVSLFDVSNVKSPKEIAKYVSDEKYASSTAEYEHKAFLFSKEKDLMVIPMYSWDYQQQEGYNGALVFKITKDEIEARGVIDHAEGSQNRYSANVERSLYIEELLYTKSPTLLRINEIDDLSSVKKISLTSTSGPLPVYEDGLYSFLLIILVF